MTSEQQSSLFDRIRNCLREIQLAVYRIGMSGRYHTGMARDMYNDVEKVHASTHVSDVSEYQKRLPSLVERIEELDSKAHSLWLARDCTDELVAVRAGLNAVYDQLQFQPRVYERLARQSEKPLLETANLACRRLDDDTRRIDLENTVLMRAEEYVQLEARIAELIFQIDEDRDSFALLHREFTDEYVRSRCNGDRMSLAAGYIGMRSAVNCFDDRSGYQFTDYAIFWIDRELSRIGRSASE